MYGVWAHHTGTCISTTKENERKHQSLFSIVAIRANFSAICQVRATMVPEKFDVIQMWYATKKSRVVEKSSGSKVSVFTFMGALLYGP
jgi:hypothetical protein